MVGFVAKLFVATPLEKRRARGVLDRLLHPSFGSCGRCGMTWATVKGHETPYEWFGEFTEANGERVAAAACFPLCVECWTDLTPAERLPYYRALFTRWELYGRDSADWSKIESSVLQGL